ncbi:hypothetical protein QJS83_04585 [Bdellovibrio sp. 22V]|uniref:hypothetical protein n=1 Tax=Bdellovibrio sp. 22V TaxID=3044166 RepID=UPI0025426CE1|nr:hypothetical protein [Bdellovibrio sp. 22V]WII73149.1 hypothetical protein QJS83_04585 [Bdellovibrio sp. 22V]
MLKKALTFAKNNYLLVAFLFLGVLSFVFSKSPEDKPETFIPAPRSVDTFIPRGFVLVPIEIANASSLASLVGDVGGVVDLYLASGENKKGGYKVGTKLKLLRAPLNPEQYAVLVREDESSRLLSHTGPFIAVVQNPDEKGNQVASTATSSRIRVEYQN